MAGLKNVLKGGLSNYKLGDEGGFEFYGQNIYAKAIKCNLYDFNIFS